MIVVKYKCEEGVKFIQDGTPRTVYIGASDRLCLEVSTVYIYIRHAAGLVLRDYFISTAYIACRLKLGACKVELSGFLA